MKIAKVAPAYIKNLRTEYKVEILDPALKAMDQATSQALSRFGAEVRRVARASIKESPGASAAARR